jgi:hypothetical protein
VGRQLDARVHLQEAVGRQALPEIAIGPPLPVGAPFEFAAEV